jgi:hypothetical protein
MSLSTVYALERSYPVPPKTKGRPPQYPWAEMKVGDSFFVPCARVEVQRRQNTIQSCKKQAMKKYKRDYVTRTTIKGIRVWRIK